MHKVPTNKNPSHRRHTWRERAFVLGGIGVAAAVTAISLALGADLEPVGPVWAAAVGWTVLATIAHALWRGFRRGDWSAFRNEYEPPHHRDTLDLATGTGVGAYQRIAEQNELLMRGHTY
jgi:hypothetical protein